MSTLSQLKKPISWLRLAVSWSGFCFLRFCEQVLPTALLNVLLWPIAAASDLLEVPKHKLFSSWRRIPKSLNPNLWRFFLRQIVGYYHEELIYVWSDRLCAYEWLSRCKLEGETDLILGRNRNRPVVLASLHFGPYETFPYWLRAHGIPTTMIRGLAGPPLFRGKIRL